MIQELKQYECSYSYCGHETEGRIDIWDTVIIPATNKVTAAYFYLILNNPAYMSKKTLEEYKKQDFAEGGWGMNIKQL